MQNILMKYAFLLWFTFIISVNNLQGQSPDGRICNCFSSPVSSDLMLRSKAVYGKIGVTITRDMELTPAESQQVKFSLPSLPLKQGCGAVYSIYITDETGTRIHESEDSHNEFFYSFGSCSKTYDVTLTAYGKSAAGGDGNCSRRIHFKVKPQCNTATCNCGAAAGQSNDRADIKFDAKVLCLTPSATQRRFTIQYTITNKTNCRMKFESLRLLGGNDINLAASDPLTARSTSIKYNMGFSTGLSVAVPTSGTTTVTLKYFLNDKACSATMKIPYESCH